MKITKIGHSCLLVETANLRLLLDPGSYTTAQNDVKNIDVILITHEHLDHFSLDSIKAIIKNNPTVKIFSNESVASLLAKENIDCLVIKDGKNTRIKNILIEGFGQKHAILYPTMDPVANIGYLIDEKLFYPGDSLCKPSKSAEILALPITGIWMKLAEAIDYAKDMKPKVCFPVHDGMLKFPGPSHTLPEKILSPLGISYNILEELKEYQF